MIQSKTNFEKQRELLLSGDYCGLFNNLKLNLPQRFFGYADPKSLNEIFHDIFTTLTEKKQTANRNSAWCFNDVMKIIMPMYQSKNMTDDIYFLKNKCGIPEKHIKIKEHLVIDTLFSTDNLFLSNYALILLCNHLLKENKSFKNDVSAPLFVQSNRTKSYDFISEMRIAFAGYFFAFNGSDEEEITKAVWNWIHGVRLKKAYDNTMKDLSSVTKHFMGAKFNYHEFEEFKQKYIFNILFGTNFIKKYDNFLESCGYTIQSDKNENIRWRKANHTAPKYPGAFFAPHIDFLLTWSIQTFCKFVRDEMTISSDKNQLKSFEKLTENFFSVMRDGYTDAINTTTIKSAPVFINQHNGEAGKISKEIKYGTGKRKTDKLTGDGQRETPGALDFYKQHDILNTDDKDCLYVRKLAEEKLLLLHEEFKNNQSPELAQKISKIENDIKKENEAVYGINIETFIGVPKKLTLNGIFIERQKTDEQKDADTNNAEKSDIKISIPAKDQYDLFYDLSPESIFKDLYAIRETTEIFHRFSPKGNGWVYDNCGVYECINEFIQERPGDLWKTQKNENSKTGRTRLNCKLKYMMFEWDHLPLTTQLEKVQENINVICQATYSGNKSIHIKIAAADEPKTLEEYDWLREHILIKLGFVDSDPNVKDNSRTSRVPGAINPKTGYVQQLLHFNPDAKFSENWRPLFIDDKNAKSATKTNSVICYDNNDKLKNYWIQKVMEIRVGLKEGNQTETLKSIINTASCAVLSKEDFESLLKDFLTKDHHRDIASLYEYRKQRMY